MVCAWGRFFPQRFVTCWTRRAKLKLRSIPVEIAEATVGKSGHVVEAQVIGTMADGGPVCATIKPHAVTWGLVRDVD